MKREVGVTPLLPWMHGERTVRETARLGLSTTCAEERSTTAALHKRRMGKDYDSMLYDHGSM